MSQAPFTLPSAALLIDLLLGERQGLTQTMVGKRLNYANSHQPSSRATWRAADSLNSHSFALIQS